MGKTVTPSVATKGRGKPSVLKLRSRGRGRRYSPLRGLLESTLAVLYAGDWPARLWSRVPGSTSVREIRRTLTIPAGEGGRCRVAFVSDLHVGPTTSPSLHEGLIAIVRAARPDVLLLGGDYVYLEATSDVVARLARLVTALEAPTKLAVMGNHDLWTEDTLVAGALEQGGARVLVNDVARLPDPWGDVAVVGLDDPWTGDCDGAQAFARVGDARFRVVLCHSPDGLLSVTAHPFEPLRLRPHSRRAACGALGADRAPEGRDVPALPVRLRAVERRGRVRVARRGLGGPPGPALRGAGRARPRSGAGRVLAFFFGRATGPQD